MSAETLQHAILLYQQSRYTDAEQALREHLRGDPDDAGAIHLLAEVHAAQGRLAEARDAAQRALGLYPGHAGGHELLARIELRDDNVAKAEEHARQAVEADPADPSNHATLGFVLLYRKRNEEALEYADRGLAIDPEDLRCLNLRTEALARLGRKEEADNTIAKALELDPDNAGTHANTGWAMLRRGEEARALENFREALRRDPTNEYAKAGLVEALKARYLIYRWFLRYTMWVSSLGGRTQWFLILGLYFGARILRGMAQSNPALEPLIYPILGLYLVFVISTWVITPLSDLLLRLNPYGRYALDKDELMTSNFTGGALLLALSGGLGWAITGMEGMAAFGIFGLVMMIPVSSMLGGGRRGTLVLVAAAALLALLGLAGVAFTFMHAAGADGLFLAFLVGAFAYQFLANFVRIRS